MLLALQRYNVHIVFVPGTQMYVADLLSRLHLKNGKQLEFDEIYEIEQVNMLKDVPISDERVKAILKATLADDDMRKLTDLVIHGFPAKIHDVPESLRNYHKINAELSTQNGLIFKGNRIVIPTALRREMLKRLHYAHSGIENSTKLARDTMYWPGIQEQLSQEVRACETCQKIAPNLPKEPMMSTEIPSLLFEVVSMDIMELNESDGNKKRYLVTVDHFSDFFEIDELKNMLAETIINCCKHNFARHGIPRMVITDNGTHFNNKLFQKFSADWEFQYSTSSPYHAQSNGKAESAIKIAKNIVKKAKDSKTDVYLALLNWRNTPNKMNTSPVQRLYSRRTRCVVPVVANKLKPAIQRDVPSRIERNKQQSKFYFDRTTMKMKPLEIGDPVYVKLKGPDSPWTSGSVVDRHNERSYNVSVSDGVYRRNRHDLKPRIEPMQARDEENMVSTSSGGHQLQLSSAIEPADVQPNTSGHEDTQLAPTIQAPATATPKDNESATRTRKSGQFPADQPTSDARPKRQTKAPARFSDFDMHN